MDLDLAVDGEVLRSGFLHKRGHLVKNWKRRLFVLTREHLRYYENSARGKPKGEVDMSTVLRVLPPAQGDNQFEIRTIRGKDFTLRAENHAEASAWARDLHGIHVAPSPLAMMQSQIQHAVSEGAISDDDRIALLEIMATGDPEDMKRAKEEYAIAKDRYRREKKAAAPPSAADAPTSPEAAAAAAAASASGDGTAAAAAAAAAAAGSGSGSGSSATATPSAADGHAPPVPEYSTTELPPLVAADFEGEDSLFENDWELGKRLGDGGYSVVHECVHKTTREHAAVKVIEKSRLEEPGLRALRHEVHVMKQLHHPNIVGFKAFYNEPTQFFLVIELMEGGELFDRIIKRTHYSEREARDIVLTLANALAYMHNKEIAHRDLKPENILLSSPDDRTAVIKLADLGFARSAVYGLNTRCGTPSYVAPEILEGRQYGVEVDIWGLGVITYILLCGYAPFSNSNQARLFQLIRQGRYYFDSPYWDNVSDNAKDLIRRMLMVSTGKRITANEILTHPWVSGTVGSADLTGVLSKMSDFKAEGIAIVKEGYMTKQGGLIKSWKRRLFQLTGEMLSYMEDDTSAPKGVIRLRQIRKLTSSKDDPAMFVIVTSLSRDYVIKAESEEEKKEWMKAITTTCQRQDLMFKAQYAMNAAGTISSAKEARELVGLSNEWRDIRTSVSGRASPHAGSGGGGGGAAASGSGSGGGSTPESSPLSRRVSAERKE